MKDILHCFTVNYALLASVMKESRNAFMLSVSFRSCHRLDYDGVIINFSTRWGHVHTNTQRAVSQLAVKTRKCGSLCF